MKNRRPFYGLIFYAFILTAGFQSFATCPTETFRLFQGYGFTTDSDDPSGSDVCQYTRTLSVFANETLTVYGDITITENLYIYGTLILYGTLTVAKDLIIDADGSFLVQPGSTLNVNGNMINGGWFAATFRNLSTDGDVEGTINVAGDFYNNEDGNITIGPGGIVDVGGTYYNNEGSSTMVENGGTLNASSVAEDPNGTFTVDGANPDASCDDGCCGAACAALPVELVSFTADVDPKGTVTLSWVTATEINNKGFYLQRATVSDQALAWTDVSFIKGNGNKESNTYYRYIDEDFHDDSYYRLKQVDYDGAYEMHEMIFVAGRELSNISVYPNPFRSRLTIDLPQGIYSASLRTLSGDECYSLHDHNSQDTKRGLEQACAKLKTGTYILIISNGYKQHITKILKQ